MTRSKDDVPYGAEGRPVREIAGIIQQAPDCPIRGEVNAELGKDATYTYEWGRRMIAQMGATEHGFRSLVQFSRTSDMRGPVRAEWIAMFWDDPQWAERMLVQCAWLRDGMGWGLDEEELDHLLRTIEEKHPEPERVLAAYDARLTGASYRDHPAQLSRAGSPTLWAIVRNGEVHDCVPAERAEFFLISETLLPVEEIFEPLAPGQRHLAAPTYVVMADRVEKVHRASYLCARVREACERLAAGRVAR